MSFAVLALLCLVALAGPVLSLTRASHLPVVVGELAVGLALGATGLRVLPASDHTFSFLAEIGFGLVMFVAGSHVPVRDPALRAGLLVGAARAVCVGVLAALLGGGLGLVFGTGHGALYAVVLASSSAAMVMPTLNGVPLDGRAVVQLLPQVALADAASIVLLPLVIDPAHVMRAAIGAGAVLLAAAVIFLFLRWLERTGRRKAIHDLSQDHSLAIELRLALTLLFALAALAATLHISIMLAGFALGLAYAAIGEPRRLSHQIFAVTEGLFSPIFFVWLGASLDLRQLGAHPTAIGLGLALGVGALIVHGAMAVTRQPLPMAALTAAQMGVPVAAATLGTNLGVLAPGEDAALLLGAMVTVIAVGVLSGPVTRIATTAAEQASDGKGGAAKNGAAKGGG
ncbi:cation:proton antiporter [Raineyella sp. LH-20]|uniref:cation:proton antiporter n=1 Tax=Raineyella sp. LH-20 TaxID=3081204 RepID=UPI002953A58B|nr:cation:proton antiporter [Raineyella sp. LH-20]WOP20015.1 cation:proton antiporter [Raineyella sp. LH-20]